MTTAEGRSAGRQALRDELRTLEEQALRGRARNQAIAKANVLLKKQGMPPLTKSVSDWFNHGAPAKDFESLWALVQVLLDWSMPAPGTAAGTDHSRAGQRAGDRTYWKTLWQRAKESPSPVPPPTDTSSVTAPGGPVAVTCEVEADYMIQRSWSDGVPVSGGLVRIFVEACEDRAVLLRAMRPIVVARRPPVSGTQTMHWGIPEVRKYDLNLDLDPPSLNGPKFLYTVTPSDPEVFEVTVRCDRYDVEWRLELDWTCAGRVGTSVVDLGGYPFRFTARR